jgi:tetratricopeptide (TPR) repeat protein
MRQYYFFLLGLTILFFTACTGKKKLADPDDYNAFLKPGIIQQEAEKIKEQIHFWQNRLQKDTGNFVDMLELASCHLRLFKLQGNVTDLHYGDSLLKRSNSKLVNKDPNILFALSQNSITRHKFRDADFFNEAAEKAGGDAYTARLLEFDTKMELGELMTASKKIETVKDRSSFDYLIRKAKLEDHKGNLDGAIKLMEQAFDKVKSGHRGLYCWALSNLGDMYGHAGRVKDSYNAYLNVLQKDSSYIYALKGIAWIAYSHDHNTKEAKRIYQYILSQTNMPDLYLNLAEIEEWEGNEEKKKEYIAKFIRQVETPAYGDMYNKYLIQLYTEEIKDFDKALLLAEKEVIHRATPETYDWLAWVYFNKGDKQQANIIASNYVYKRNFEPDAVLHTALIFSEAGKKDKAKLMLKECMESAFEMGPVKTRFVQQQIEVL